MGGGQVCWVGAWLNEGAVEALKTYGEFLSGCVGCWMPELPRPLRLNLRSSSWSASRSVMDCVRSCNVSRQRARFFENALGDGLPLSLLFVCWFVGLVWFASWLCLFHSAVGCVRGTVAFHLLLFREVCCTGDIQHGPYKGRTAQVEEHSPRSGQLVPGQESNQDDKDTVAV